MDRTEAFDAIVVGSGIGGLAAASLLARVGGRRVLVLERHFKPGGFTHTFQRQRWSWDVGVHYVGEMKDGTMPRRLLDLASGGALAWTKMPSPLERFAYPGFTFEVPEGERAYREALAAAFPRERHGVARWFSELRGAARWAERHFVGLSLPRAAAALLEAPGRSRALRTTAQVIDRTFRDPLLRAVVASQWGDYGLPPSRSAFALHALVASSYLDGGYYPVGGAGRIASTFLAQIESAGGACRVNHEVAEILVEGGRAAGVRARAHGGGRDGTVTFRAPIVISDAGLGATYRLAGLGGRPEPAGGMSCVTVYLGLKESPAALGLGAQNHWFFDGVDHDAAFARRDDLLRGTAHGAFLSFPSLKDPEARAHTGEIVTFMDAEPFRAWRDQPWKRRDHEYEALKATMAGALLDLVERHHRGFRDLVAYQEVSTPLTVEHFTGHPGGRIYGAPGTPDRFRDPAHGVRTPVPGLLLAGADATTLGVVGAFMGGALAAGAALGRFGIRKILEAAARAPRGAGPAVSRKAA